MTDVMTVSVRMSNQRRLLWRSGGGNEEHDARFPANSPATRTAGTRARPPAGPDRPAPSRFRRAGRELLAAEIEGAGAAGDDGRRVDGGRDRPRHPRRAVVA